MAITNRSFTAGRFQLELDGDNTNYNVAYLKKFSGLHMIGDVVMNDVGPDNIQMKHLANIKWAPGKATVGIGMGKAVYEWIQASFDKKFMVKSGEVVAADFDSTAQTRMNFLGALITSVGIPKLDGASKEPAYFDIEFEAEQVRWVEASGPLPPPKLGPKQKAWLCSNFRVEIDLPGGRSLPCDRVASVDAFAWKCAVMPNQVGIFRESTKHPAKVTVPDLKLTVSSADFKKWSEVAHQWFVDGQHRERDHLTGRIVFLDPNMKDELGEITLDGVGFKQFGQDDNEANSERIKRFTCELYVEKMKFKIKEYDL